MGSAETGSKFGEHESPVVGWRPEEVAEVQRKNFPGREPGGFNTFLFSKLIEYEDPSTQVINLT